MDFPSVIVFIAWLLGGFVSGLTGIGGAMLAVPLAAMFIPMHDVILLSCILNLAMDGTLTCMYLRHCRFSALAPLLAGAIPGAFIGLVILQAVSGRILQGGVGLLLLSYVCWQFFARRSGRERSSWGPACWVRPYPLTDRRPAPMPSGADGSPGKRWGRLACFLSCAV